MEQPTTPGYVTLEPVFYMPQTNRSGTALQIYRESKQRYMLHFIDAATGTMAIGFLNRDELKQLRDALNKELGS